MMGQISRILGAGSLGGTLPLILTIGLLVGGNFTLAKYAVQSDIPAFAVFYWQLLAAGLMLLIVMVVRGEKLPTRPKHLAYYLINGLMGSSLPQIIAYAALVHVPAGVFTVLITLSPLFTFLVSSAVEARWLPMVRLVGILTGLMGVSLATWSGFDPAAAAPLWLLFAAASPLCLAVNNVYRAKALPVGVSPLALATGSLVLQLPLLWPFLIWTGFDYQPFSLQTGADLAVMGIGLITAVSYILTFELQKRTDGLGMSQMGYFVTISGIIMGAIFFGESIRFALIASVLLLFLGLALTNGHLTLSNLTSLVRNKI